LQRLHLLLKTLERSRAGQSLLGAYLVGPHVLLVRDRYPNGFLFLDLSRGDLACAGADLLLIDELEQARLEFCCRP